MLTLAFSSSIVCPVHANAYKIQFSCDLKVSNDTAGSSSSRKQANRALKTCTHVKLHVMSPFVTKTPVSTATPVSIHAAIPRVVIRDIELSYNPKEEEKLEKLNKQLKLAETDEYFKYKQVIADTLKYYESQIVSKKRLL